MADSLAPRTTTPTGVLPAREGESRRWFTSRQMRRLRESLLAYLFLLPSIFIIGLFGLFPLLFAAYQSTLKGLNKIVGTFDGLGNYIKAVDMLTYVLGFWGAIFLVVMALRTLAAGRAEAKEKNQPFWHWLPAGVSWGAAFSAVIFLIITLLPQLLGIPDQMRGKNNTPERFQELLGEVWAQPAVAQALWLAGLLIALGIVLTVLTPRFTGKRGGGTMQPFVSATAEIALAATLFWLTWEELQKQLALAETAGGLDIATQFLFISAGFALVWFSWQLWGSAAHQPTLRSTFFRLGGAAMLLVGAWVLIAELPRVIGSGDKVWWDSLLATLYYSMGTIPAQLIVALVLAVLLFQDIKGKTVFRMLYFLPYIAPFVGTAAVFKVMFSARSAGPVNSLLAGVGVGPFQWLNEPGGIFDLLTPGMDLPGWASGPSLALVVVMLYGVWTFFGFNTVIFLAGLGNIPKEMYEAASIDGAGRWEQFRNITLPLLSPTIYFLTLYSVIGTFKAFNHIYVLRNGAALGTTDTASVVIFQAFKRDTRYGYASALAILLLLIIIGLTVINNRIANKRVFYG
jgi:multiple sugar transport system permease protein